MVKKNSGTLSSSQKRSLIAQGNSELSIARQCDLIGLARSSYYYSPCVADAEDLRLMHAIDELYMQYPFYGSLRITASLRRLGWVVNRKRVVRLMRLMGLQAVYPRPKTSQPSKEHRVYPYLLRGLKLERVNQVWSTDLTYIPIRGGWMYLMAVMDWYSRYVIAWDISNSMETEFCCEVLRTSLGYGLPEIFNSDQGSQFTAVKFTTILESEEVSISMDGRARAIDNVFIERLWRSLKYEDIYIKDYQTVPQLRQGLQQYFLFYNTVRQHQALDYRTPLEVYQGATSQR